jgi:hypothetical protein
MGRGAPSGPPPRRALAPKMSACAVSERGDVGIEIQSAAGRERSVAGGYAGGAKANAFAAWTTGVSLLVRPTYPGANGPAVRTARIQLGFPDPSRTGALSSVLAALAVVAAPRDAARVARWVSPVRASAVSRHGERSNFGERRAREAVVPSSNALVITRPRRLKPPASRRASR